MQTLKRMIISFGRDEWVSAVTSFVRIKKNRKGQLTGLEADPSAMDVIRYIDFGAVKFITFEDIPPPPPPEEEPKPNRQERKKG